MPVWASANPRVSCFSSAWGVFATLVLSIGFKALTTWSLLHFTQMRNYSLIQWELAQALNLSVGKAHYCVQALLNKGWVKMHKFHDSTRKRAYLYLLTPADMAQKTAMTMRFLERKMADYDWLRKRD